MVLGRLFFSGSGLFALLDGAIVVDYSVYNCRRYCVCRFGKRVRVGVDNDGITLLSPNEVERLLILLGMKCGFEYLERVP